MVRISKGEEAVVDGRREELVRPMQNFHLETECSFFIRLVCVYVCVYRALASPVEREIDIGCSSCMRASPPALLLSDFWLAPNQELSSLLCNDYLEPVCKLIE